MNEVQIRPVARRDREDWLRLRGELWPRHAPEELSEEAEEYLAPDGLSKVAGVAVPAAVFVAEIGAPTRLVGFVEVSARPFAEGCRTSPVGYLEGWFVSPEHRNRGVGTALVRAAEAWARAHGCTEMASDTWLDNIVSESAHKALGYEVVERAIHFRRNLT